MRACVFQHIQFEDLGCIEPWLITHRYTVATTRFFAGDAIPDIDTVDFLIILGGPMSINDEHIFPWLIEEKHFTKKMMERKKPVLGICLGAQIIASALGAAVYPNREKEIGWFSIQAAQQSPDKDIFRFPDSILVFHWHGETFDLPAGAVRLAQNAACTNQAFQIGEHAIGLQFHLEMLPRNIGAIVQHCGSELVPSKYIQQEQNILSAPPAYTMATNAVMEDVLAFLTKQPY
jgi:GMP synthase-like glutamine amidotransferase